MSTFLGLRDCEEDVIASLDGDLKTGGEVTEDERRKKPGISAGFLFARIRRVRSLRDLRT